MPATPTLEEQLLRLRLDGWCVVDSVIPAEDVASVRESVAAATLRHQRPDAPANIGHRTGLINYDQSFAPYLVTPHFHRPDQGSAWASTCASHSRRQ